MTDPHASSSQMTSARSSAVGQALSRLFGAVAAVEGADDGLDRAAQLIATEARRHLEGSQVVISIVSRDRPDMFRSIGGAGRWAETVVGGEWPIEGTVHGRALLGSGALEVQEPAEESAAAHVLEAGGIRTGRLIPLVAGAPMPDGRFTLGVIGFWWCQPHDISDEERVLTDQLAHLASLLLLRVEAWHAASRGDARLELRRAIAENVQTSLDIVEVVNRTVDQLRHLTRADRVTLSRITGNEIEVLASVDADPSHELGPQRLQLSQVLGNSVVAEVMAERRSASGPVAPPADEGEAMLLGRRGEFVLVPLVIRQEVTGLISLVRRTGGPFRSDEIAELEIAASVAALALRSAGLYAESQAALRARSAFLNMAAHELRTPFAVIAGYLSLLQEGAFGVPPPAWEQPLRTITEKTQELGALVDQILVAARAESGRLVRASVRIDLADAARAAADRAASRLDLHGGHIAVDTAQRTLVAADPAAVATILDNLIGNAITYRREAPEIRIGVASDAAARRGVVTVRDNGRGIPEKDQRQVFDQFHRVEIEGFSNPAGTGLGLYIARTLATDMGGVLELAWSEVGSGSEFRLSLPGAAGADAEAI